MLTILDRHLIYNYLKGYLVCLVSLLGLFVIVDLFTNLDNFAENKNGLWPIIENILLYYSFKIPVIFDRTSEAIILMAAMFTIAWLQRNNEVLPLLSAGVSVRRVVRPVLFAAALMVLVAILNQELVLPRLDWYLTERRTDTAGTTEIPVQGGYESNGIHLSGRVAVKKDMVVYDFVAVFPARAGWDSLTTLQAKDARYHPAGSERGPGWLLTNTTPPELPQGARSDVLECITPGTYFLKTKDIDFDTFIRPKNWYVYYPTFSLLREMAKTHSTQIAGVAVVFHQRLTRPILGMLLVFMGLSIILRDQNRNIFISVGLCLVLCALFFTAGFACKHLGDNGFLSPALAAWAPVVTFGPLSFVMFDAVHT